MSMTDPIADLLTRIRNANMRQKPSLTVPSSKTKLAIVKVLKEEGFTIFVIWECETKTEEILNSKIEAVKSHIESTKFYSQK